MPYYSWSYSGDPTFANTNQVVCVFDSGVQANVSEASFTFDAISDTDGGSSAGIYAHFYAAGDTPPITGTGVYTLPVNPDPLAVGAETPAYGANGHWPAAGGHAVDPGTHQRVQVLVYPRGGGGGAFPRDMHLVLSGSWGGSLDTNFCAYGGQIKPDIPDIVILAPDVILTIIGLVTDGWAWAVAGYFANQAMDIRSLCTTTRPVDPGITLQDLVDLTTLTNPPALVAAAAKAWQWLQWAAWPHFCACVPGTPPAVPFPPVTQPAPPNAPSGPLADYDCDGADLCQQMRNLTLAVGSIGQRLAILSQLTTLIQRQHVPFATLNGTTHAGLTGSGEFTVQAILGLSVSFSAVPDWIGRDAADPQNLFDLGELSVGTADGWLRRERLTHSPQVILGVSGAVTRVGYTLNAGVTASIRELVREP